MKLDRGKRKNQIIIPTSAMGDIAFLLIIFFMVASTFVQEAHVELEQATSPDIETLEAAKITVSMDKDGIIWLKGVECPLDSLESGVAALLAEQEKKTVMLKIDKNLKQATFGRVLLALSKAGAEIALIGEKD